MSYYSHLSNLCILIFIMRPFKSLLIILATSGLTQSAPALDDGLKVRNVDECKAVTVIIDVLYQLQAPATSFCSSFISIPLRTVTSATVRGLSQADADKREWITLLIITDYDIKTQADYHHIHRHINAKSVGHLSCNIDLLILIARRAVPSL